MSIRILGGIIALAIPALLLPGCGRSSPTGPHWLPVAPLYGNSFEAPSDTSGWGGNAYLELVADAPPDGGRRSLSVTGGCIVPHAYIDLVVGKEPCLVGLRCWGKSRLHSTGGISIFRKGDLRGISVIVSDTVWTQYTSSSSLRCAARDTIRLELHCGGYIPGSMLVDLVEVAKVL